MGLYTKATFFCNKVNSLYSNKSFFKELENKYPNCKAVLLINYKNSFVLYSSYNVSEKTKKKLYSSKDFWNGTFSQKDSLIQITDECLLPYRQLFSSVDNDCIDTLFIERYSLNDVEYINLLSYSNVVYKNYDKIIRLNMDIKHLLPFVTH